MGLKHVVAKSQHHELLYAQAQFARFLDEGTIGIRLLENALLARDGANGTDGLFVIRDVNFHIQLKEFYSIVTSLEKVQWLLYGTTDGAAFGVGQSHTCGSMAFVGANLTTVYHCLDSDGFVKSIDVERPYDSRTRPWYLAGQVAPSGNYSWSPAFLDYGLETPNLSIDLAKPLWVNGSFYGVMASHLFFTEINQWLEELAELGDGEVIFVVDMEGYIIASSVGSVCSDGDVGVWRKIRPTEHSSSVVRTASDALNLLFPDSDWESPGAGFSINDPASSIVYLVDVLKWTDQHGLTVFLVNAEPRVNSFRKADYAKFLSLGFSGGSLVLVVAVAVLFGCCLSNPIRKTSDELGKVARFEASNRIARGGGIKCLDVFRLYEFVRMDGVMTELHKSLSRFSRFIPRDIVATLVREGSHSLRLQRQDITVMFVDVQGFTKLTEILPPDALVGFLTEFFNLTTEAIANSGGTIDKLIGDCVMAFWNAPRIVPGHALRAVRAAMRILEEIDLRNAALVPGGGRIPFDVRCGINSGEALVGLIGSRAKCSYTALGDTVNIAARLEPIALNYSSRILVGPKTQDLVKDVFDCRLVDTVILKGKMKPLQIYAVVAAVLSTPSSPGIKFSDCVGLKREDENQANVGIGKKTRID